MKKILLLTTVLFTFIRAYSQHVEWKDVAPVVYRECATCHRPGEIGEAYLNCMGYSLLVNSPYFYSIPYYVSTKLMPPWKADPSYHHYLDERILTQDEINSLDSFVNQVGLGNYDPGDTTLAPDPPVYSEGSQLGTPDTTLTMAMPFTIPGDFTDHYQCFVLHPNLTETKNIKGIEFRAGNAAIVHHVFVYSCDNNSADSMDATTPEYGYPSFGGASAQVDFVSLYGPGMIPRFYPQGSGLKWKAGTSVVIQIHYAPTTVEQTDQSSVNLFYTDDADIREVKGKRIGEDPQFLVEPVFFILKDKVLTFHSEFTLDTTYSMFSIAPHMHLIGKSFKIYAMTPEQDSIPLCYVPSWDFRWQLLYSFNNFVILPKGTVIHAEGTYDNTSNNPNNPNNPPINVGYGESSLDEMFKYFVYYLEYRPGDEDVVFDSTWHPVGVPDVSNGIVSTPQLYAPIPNPSSNEAVFNYFLPVHGDASIYVYDLSGRLVSPMETTNEQASGFHRKTLDVSKYTPGTYFFTLVTEGKRITKEFVVQH